MVARETFLYKCDDDGVDGAFSLCEKAIDDGPHLLDDVDSFERQMEFST